MTTHVYYNSEGANSCYICLIIIICNCPRIWHLQLAIVLAFDISIPGPNFCFIFLHKQPAMVTTGQEKVREKINFSRFGKSQGIFNLIRENGNLWKSYTKLFQCNNSLKNICPYNWITVFQGTWTGIFFKYNGTFWLLSYAIAHSSKSLKILYPGRETKPHAGSLTNFFKERQ